LVVETGVSSHYLWQEFHCNAHLTNIATEALAKEFVVTPVFGYPSDVSLVKLQWDVVCVKQDIYCGLQAPDMEHMPKDDSRVS
jgi:hypothetical protein